MRRNGTLILCYHRVAEGVEDPFYLCVRPGNFAAHLEEMSRAREPSTLADVSVPSRRPRVVVTFDDGYRDNLTNALPIAESKGVPITVFVTSGIRGKPQGSLVGSPRNAVALAATAREGDRSAGRRPERPAPARFVRDQAQILIRSAAICCRSGDGDQRRTRRRLGAVAGGFRSPARRRNAHPRGPPPAGGQRHRPTIGAHTVDHVRLRDRLGPRAAGLYLWFKGGAGAVDRPGRVALRLPVWPPRVTSTIGRSRPCVRLRSTPRAPPSPDRPGPRRIRTASPGAWSWTGDGFASELRCNGGSSGERRSRGRCGVEPMRRKEW